MVLPASILLLYLLQSSRRAAQPALQCSGPHDMLTPQALYALSCTFYPSSQGSGTACSAAVPNAALVVLALYALYYTALEQFAGLSWGVLLALPMWLSATAFAQRVPYAWAWAIGVHALSWFVQARSVFWPCTARCLRMEVPCACSLALHRSTHVLHRRMFCLRL